MKVRSWFIVLTVILFAVGAFAGMGVTMHCKSCKFTSQVNLGGGFTFEQQTGYCANCEKFVYLSWKRGEKMPAPMARIWDSATGQTLPLYNCPECSTPFLLLQSALEHCPKCGRKTLEQDESAGTIMYD